MHYLIHTFIIILSCYQHGYPWPSHATPPDRSSLLASLQGYTPYLHKSVECKFELTLKSDNFLIVGDFFSIWGSDLWQNERSMAAILLVPTICKVSVPIFHQIFLMCTYLEGRMFENNFCCKSNLLTSPNQNQPAAFRLIRRIVPFTLTCVTLKYLCCDKHQW